MLEAIPVLFSTALLVLLIYFWQKIGAPDFFSCSLCIFSMGTSVFFVLDSRNGLEIAVISILVGFTFWMKFVALCVFQQVKYRRFVKERVPKLAKAVANYRHSSSHLVVLGNDKLDKQTLSNSRSVDSISRSVDSISRSRK